MSVNIKEMKEVLIGELMKAGFTRAHCAAMAENVFANIRNPDIPLTAQFGWLYDGQDGYVHWSREKPDHSVDPGETAKVASHWEMFFFNKFENTSEKMMQVLAVAL